MSRSQLQAISSTQRTAGSGDGLVAMQKGALLEFMNSAVSAFSDSALNALEVSAYLGLEALLTEIRVVGAAKRQATSAGDYYSACERHQRCLERARYLARRLGALLGESISKSVLRQVAETVNELGALKP